VIADDVWAKLMWAGLNLQAAGLPGCAGSYYPIELLRAVTLTWLFSGLRSDEIARLRVGCIRWQHDGQPITGDAADVLAEDAVCLLEVPVHKTGTAFTKPVDPIVGQAIEAWQALRPAQPSRLDRKTSEHADILFSVRAHPVARDYINRALIPALCAKAGVPDADVRGKITSHRARSTIASQRRFPRRAYGGAWAGRLAFGRLTHSRALGILANPVYAGAYVFGRFRSRRTVSPDGTVRTATSELPRAEWAVLIPDHHEGYIDWDTFLANEAKLAGNRTSAGARPPREGLALCQGIVFCGSCGRAMPTHYAGGQPYYECACSRADHVATADCRSVRAATVDDAVAAALLAAVSLDQLALALAAADEVTTRRARSLRAAELTAERARYAAERAERAHAACEPENRLVARSLETRWETRLVELARRRPHWPARQPPLPPAGELAAAVADLPTLWSAPATSDRDRKRVMRTLLGDITLRPGKDPHQLRAGLRWNSGATEELIVTRARPVTEWRRATPEAVALARELGPRLTNPELAAALNAAGHRTGTGKLFDRTAATNPRYAYRIGSPDLLAEGELTPRVVAERLGVAVGAAHRWLSAGTLPARRSPTGRWCIPFPSDVENECRARIAASPHLHRDADGLDRQPGELSIAELAT
jgi:hypothetical protein